MELLSSASLEDLAGHLGKAASGFQKPRSVRRVSGGCINACFRVEFPEGIFFLKSNDARRFPGMFQAESRGLQALHQSGAVRVPRVLTHGQDDNHSWLWLEWIESGPRAADHQQHLGRSLAELHRNSSPVFGHHPDNYIGSLPQINPDHADGRAFLRHARYEPMREMAARTLGGLPPQLDRLLDAFMGRLDQIFPPEPPALLHGDLWSGNVISGLDGRAVLLDPAVYYGYREADLAMMQLFGGFGPACFDTYEECFPLEPGWTERVAAHQVYPLMVHVALFGKAYLGDLVRSIERYT